MPLRTRRNGGVRHHPAPKIVTMDMMDLEPYEGNPRDNEDAVESVKNSIQNFGFLVPIVIDANNTIVAGHTRYEAATRLGLSQAPCIVADHLTEDQIKAFRIIDNKVSELARWDFDQLSTEITALSDSGIQFTEMGFGQDEIDCLTEVVAEDCMSAGVAAGEQRAAGPAEQRAPTRTRLVLGEFVIFIPTDVYRRWASQIRTEMDYVESDIEAHLKFLLGITPYEDT